MEMIGWIEIGCGNFGKKVSLLQGNGANPERNSDVFPAQPPIQTGIQSRWFGRGFRTEIFQILYTRDSVNDKRWSDKAPAVLRSVESGFQYVGVQGMDQ